MKASLTLVLLLPVVLLHHGRPCAGTPPPPRIRSQLQQSLNLANRVVRAFSRRPPRERRARIPANTRLVGGRDPCPNSMIPASLRSKFKGFDRAPWGVTSLLRRGRNCYLWWLPGENTF